MPYLFPLPSTSFSLFLPPSLSLSVLLLAPGKTIKSFPGFSRPMSRMMRICLLNQNSHLLHPSICPLLRFLHHLLPLLYCFLCLLSTSFIVYSVVIYLFSCHLFNNSFAVFFLLLSHSLFIDSILYLSIFFSLYFFLSLYSSLSQFLLHFTLTQIKVSKSYY